jgi:hypothetical protein
VFNAVGKSKSAFVGAQRAAPGKPLPYKNRFANGIVFRNTVSALVFLTTDI